ncbi:uncharacterized protein LOC131069764 [Cryptomeria japonica]|uniref:uncharacterized protein LOC131069764 n=1 Tax=Cryptomeria japonica TaxID=3369 RepID=UPI0027DA914D|nr:uncharacterized protein LOC131069764 [Cryptomeria japonica]
MDRCQQAETHVQLSEGSTSRKSALKMMCQGIREAEYYRTLYFTNVPPERRAPGFSQLSRRSGQSQTKSRGVTGPLQRAPLGGDSGTGVLASATLPTASGQSSASRPSGMAAFTLQGNKCSLKTSKIGAQKFHPDHAFLQTWDKDIFLESFTDFSLEGSDGGILRAHKAILAGKSKVFKTMLRAGMSESASGKVKISDMTAGELRPFVNFLYTGRVNQRNLECHGVALYRASHKYDLPLLTAICERFLQFNVFRDVRGVFELAVNYGVEKFQEAVLPFIFSEGFVESNPPPLVLKTVRAASKFECFTDYRKKNLKVVPFLMELAYYRIADYLDDPHKGVEEQNKMLLFDAGPSTSTPCSSGRRRTFTQKLTSNTPPDVRATLDPGVAATVASFAPLTEGLVTPNHERAPVVDEHHDIFMEVKSSLERRMSEHILKTPTSYASPSSQHSKVARDLFPSPSGK